MNYHEDHRDLFGTDKRYVLCHCISADFALGAGIAKAFARMGVKAELLKNYPMGKWNGNGYCLLTSAGMGFHSGVLNLVTKQFYYHKPTYDTLRQALHDMKMQCISNDIKAVAMPAIGCGLDKLEFVKVSTLHQNIFKDTDLEILVCIR